MQVSRNWLLDAFFVGVVDIALLSSTSRSMLTKFFSASFANFFSLSYDLDHLYEKNVAVGSRLMRYRIPLYQLLNSIVCILVSPEGF